MRVGDILALWACIDFRYGPLPICTGDPGPSYGPGFSKILIGDDEIEIGGTIWILWCLPFRTTAEEVALTHLQ